MDEVAATGDGGGPHGRLVDRAWLILQRVDDLRGGMDRLGSRVDAGFQGQRERMDRLDGRMDRVDGRMDRLESRVDAGFQDHDERMNRLENRVDTGFQHQDARMDRLDRKIDTSQRWAIGVLLIAVLGFVAKMFFPTL